MTLQVFLCVFCFVCVKCVFVIFNQNIRYLELKFVIHISTPRGWMIPQWLPGSGCQVIFSYQQLSGVFFFLVSFDNSPCLLGLNFMCNHWFPCLCLNISYRRSKSLSGFHLSSLLTVYIIYKWISWNKRIGIGINVVKMSNAQSPELSAQRIGELIDGRDNIVSVADILCEVSRLITATMSNI